tara:strand:- start:903 stop:1343 length:441 start_codon:yes stop_codon:yes gene_type:complete
MTWKDILKSEKYGQKPRDKNMKERYDRLSPKPSDSPETEKAHCGSEKLDDDDPFEKKLVGNQKKIDANKDGKITGEDFKLLNKENPEKMILREIEKEGGALGMKNLKGIPNLKETLDRMVKEGKIFIHKDGDIYTHKPSRGRGFTR